MKKLIVVVALAGSLAGCATVDLPEFTIQSLQEVRAVLPQPTRANCNNNNSGPRKSIQCTFVQTQQGMVWKGGASRARKFYISKPLGDTGQDIVRLWINGQPAGEVIINPGFSGNIFRKKGGSTIVARAEVETLKLSSTGESTVYVHFETLDRPVMPDLSSCLNSATADRQSVCWTGNF